MGRGRVLSTGTRLRVAVAVMVLLVNAVHGSSLDVLPWVLLVLGADLATGATLAAAPLQPRERDVLAVAFTLAGAAVAGLALSAGAGGLPLVVIPLFRAGEAWGRKAVAACVPVFLVPAVLAWVIAAPTTPDLRPGTLVLWLALAASLGGLAVWSAHLTPTGGTDDALATGCLTPNPTRTAAWSRPSLSATPRSDRSASSSWTGSMPPPRGRPASTH